MEKVQTGSGGLRRNVTLPTKMSPVLEKVRAIGSLMKNDTVIFGGEHEQTFKCYNAYQTKRQLGKGAYGTVYLAENILGQQFALKVSYENTTKQIKKELELLNALAPFNIVPRVRDGFDFQTEFCVAMSLCEQKISEFAKQPIAVGDFCQLARTITQRVDKLHELGIIHTDLKADSFMLEKTNKLESLKIMDFSCAIQLPCPQFPPMLQTRHVRAPEVVHGQGYGKPIDMWSLGCLFYELATGQPLFPATSDEMLVLMQTALLGVPPYHSPAYFQPFNEKHFNFHQERLEKYGFNLTDAFLPMKEVLDASRRPECKPRRMSTLVQGLGHWSDAKRAQFLELLEGLLRFEPDKRWTCADVLRCAFLSQ